MIIFKFIIIAVISYLLGAIPFGLIISRLTANIDITRYGSGNIGGTNVLRIVGWGPAALVMVLDIAKAFIAVIIARTIINNGLYFFIGFPPDLDYLHVSAEVLAAMAAMAGHNWSVYIKFRGGKGVTTYFGTWLAMFPLIAIAGGIIIIAIAIIHRFMSRASMLGAITTLIANMVLTIWFNISPIYLIFSVLGTGLIVFQHRSNIERLQKGTELKLGDNVLKTSKKSMKPFQKQVSK